MKSIFLRRLANKNRFDLVSPTEYSFSLSLYLITESIRNVLLVYINHAAKEIQMQGHCIPFHKASR